MSDQDELKRWLTALGMTIGAFAAVTGLFIVGSRLVWGEWPW